MPIRKRRSICPIFSVSDLVVVGICVVTSGAVVTLAAVTESETITTLPEFEFGFELAAPFSGFGFGIHGLPDVLRIC